MLALFSQLHRVDQPCDHGLLENINIQNLPMRQYTEIFQEAKIENFIRKKWIFFIF